MRYYLLPISIVIGLSSCDSTKKVVESTEPETIVESTTIDGNSSSIEMENLDQTVRPQDDFFFFFNGNWIDKNPVPPSESRWGSFNELEISNNKKLTAILEDAAKNSYKKEADIRSTANNVNRNFTSDLQLLGYYYQSFTNLQTRNSIGLSPIQKEIDEVLKLASKDDIIPLLVKHHQVGIPSLFNSYVTQDMKNVTTNMIYISQGGIGLPNKDYYLSDDKHEISDTYTNHISNILTLAKIPNPKEKAHSVSNFETLLAKSMMSLAEQRVPENTYNKHGIGLTEKRYPSLKLKSYFELSGITVDSRMELIVEQPLFFSQIDKLITKVELEDWKNYLLWKVVNHYANQLDKAMIEENFIFYGKILTGKSEMKPMNEQAINAITNSSMNELLGKVFVGRHFSETARNRVDEMVDNLLSVFGERINKLDWMSPTTKNEALIKLKAIGRKLGYPTKYQDFSTLKFSSTNLVENNRELERFAHTKNINKLNEKVDKEEWEMPAHMINAYYHPLLNEIVFPAGIMQAPFFSEEYDDAINYGRIGMVIGHEFTHGFDDTGSKFAADGSFTNWWSDEDRKSFEERTGKLGETFELFCPVDGHCVNPDLTMGENIADLGGLTMAYYAYTKTNEFKANKIINGFSPAQRFFIAYAQLWKINYTEAELKNRIANDSHSPGMYRVNGPLMNCPEFFEAFNVKEGDEMRNSKEKVSKIW